MTTTTASSDVTPDRSRPPGASARCRSRLIGPATDSSARRMPRAMSPPSMTRRRGQVAAVGVEQQDAGHDAEPERQDDDDEVLGAEAERLLREVRPEDAEHADERRGDPEVDERPADRAVRPDERRGPRASWANVEPTACSRLGRRRPASTSSRWRRRRRQREAEDRGEQVQDGDDEDHRLGRGDVHDERPEQREPERERGVERQREDAVRGQELARGTTYGIIAASAGAKNTVTVETKTLSSRISARFVADEEQRDERERRGGGSSATRIVRRSIRST